MERMDLKEEVCDFLRMLEFERGGYQALIKEFAEESEEEELNLDEKNFAILVKRGSYCGAYIKKKAKYTVYFSGQGSAKKFPTQKSAEKWAEEKRGYLSTEKGYQFEVVKVDMGEV